MKYLFPGRRSAQIWSPTLSKAMEQISNKNFQGVKHILIHTGTNDLTGHNKNIPHMLKEIAMKATREFPAARAQAFLEAPDPPYHSTVHPSRLHRDMIISCSNNIIHLSHHLRETAMPL
ncbi:hypothetical protein SKAU_G00152620 [Synaphobranchus kaupii]|uniref:Uncharacterized protein n=1 Tax=Synaphobranchus kaupii TaxID=118154 RepID=A0A9Q1FHD6_SYNKA|nr:hypothetical protein SKAU_G00152620 [Synaphobranchus kaupii]